MDSRCVCWKPTAPDHQLDCPLGRVERERARLADTGTMLYLIPFEPFFVRIPRDETIRIPYLGAEPR